MKQLGGTKTVRKSKPTITEDFVQTQIVQYLRLKGFIVLVTSVRKGRVDQRTGRWEGYGTSLGIPDLLVSRENWPEAVWLGLEVKRPDKSPVLTPAQKELLAAGRIVIVQSIEDADKAIEDFVWSGS